MSLRLVHQCSSCDHDVVDLFADRCTRVESTGVHQEVIQDILVGETYLQECRFQRHRTWCSCDGFVLLDEEIKGRVNHAFHQ